LTDPSNLSLRTAVRPSRPILRQAQDGHLRMRIVVVVHVKFIEALRQLVAIARTFLILRCSPSWASLEGRTDVAAEQCRTIGSLDDPCRLGDGMEEHVAAGRRPVWRNLFRLVVAEAVNAGAHHHRGRRHPVYPAGIMPGTGHDVPMRIA